MKINKYRLIVPAVSVYIVLSLSVFIYRVIYVFNNGLEEGCWDCNPTSMTCFFCGKDNIPSLRSQAPTVR